MNECVPCCTIPDGVNLVPAFFTSTWQNKYHRRLFGYKFRRVHCVLHARLLKNLIEIVGLEMRTVGPNRDSARIRCLFKLVCSIHSVKEEIGRSRGVKVTWPNVFLTFDLFCFCRQHNIIVPRCIASKTLLTSPIILVLYTYTFTISHVLPRSTSRLTGILLLQFYIFSSEKAHFFLRKKTGSKDINVRSNIKRNLFSAEITPVKNMKVDFFLPIKEVPFSLSCMHAGDGGSFPFHPSQSRKWEKCDWPDTYVCTRWYHVEQNKSAPAGTLCLIQNNKWKNFASIIS